MKTLFTWVFAVVLMGTATGCNKGSIHFAEVDRDADKPTAKHLDAWREQAQLVMLASATNDIVGFRRVIDYRVDDYQDAITNWNGSVTAEFVNSIGGVDRTNFLYLFRVYGGAVHVEQDYYNMALNSARASK